jgi:hypothetical protein
MISRYCREDGYVLKEGEGGLWRALSLGLLFPL